MPGHHKLTQTAFRFPPCLVNRLRNEAERQERTMTSIAIEAIDAHLSALEAHREIGGQDGIGRCSTCHGVTFSTCRVCERHVCGECIKGHQEMEGAPKTTP